MSNQSPVARALAMTVAAGVIAGVTLEIMTSWEKRLDDVEAALPQLRLDAREVLEEIRTRLAVLESGRCPPPGGPEE